jgi:hypothetical protein
MVLWPCFLIQKETVSAFTVFLKILKDNYGKEYRPEAEKQYYHVGCKTGWTFYLANIKSLYEGGKDLRNKNDKLQQMLNS